MPAVAPRKRSARIPRTDNQTTPSVHPFPTDLGWMGIVWRGPQPLRIIMGYPSRAALLATLEADVATANAPPAEVQNLAERLADYAAGEVVDFQDVRLDLSHLSDFQRRVAELCRRIPRGKTLSYGQLAAKAGNPGAARAVGSVMSSNRFPILIPCHRVVGAGGKLGGFSAPEGISVKQRMLQLEDAVIMQQAAKRPRKAR